MKQQKIGVRKFNLFFLGESLMHKSLFEMIQLANDNGIQTRLNTNASFLDSGRRATFWILVWIF